MTSKLRIVFALTAAALIATACSTDGATARAFEMSDADVAMPWVVTAFQEEACGAPRVAGGEIAGSATFGVLGPMDLQMSAAWDIAAANPDPDAATYQPDSPHAGGPFAPVLSGDDYPHAFAAAPFPSDTCDGSEVTTGELELASAAGPTITARVTGGETHRLDVNTQGDGIEAFVEIEFEGGTGDFAGASGSAVLHLITHVDPTLMQFVIDEVEILSGGTIRY